MASIHIEITPSAVEFIIDLLRKKESEKPVGVRLYVTQPGTPKAETCLTYCVYGEESAADELIDEHGFKIWLDYASLKYLEGAKIDFNEDQLGGQLSIVAPNSRLPQIDENSSLSERVNYILANDINPGLASHGGFVSLVELVDNDSVAVLQFGGGCQGCGMVDYTLKEGIEKSLLQHIPELKGVRDVTDHSESENAFYK